MCGIVYKSNFYTPTNEELFVKSVNKLIARGPDDYGYLFLKNHSFGHRRLAVRDILNSKQPMSILNNHLIYNGEIYNVDELKKLLDEPLEFKSDTLLLLKLLNKYKEKILNKINGIFSFVYAYDDEVLIVRDMFGVKPLYYSFIDKDIIVASEIKAILEYTDNRVIDDDGLYELIGMGPSHTPGKTIYKGIYELKPGHLIKFNKEKFEIVEYYKLPVRHHDLSYNATVRLVKELLDDAIVSQMVSDVGLASFLSGGLDSSIVSTVLANNKDCLDTYSINYLNSNFKENEFEKSLDSDYTSLVSAYIYSHQNDIYIDDKTLVEGLKKVVHLKDGPTMTDIDSSLLYLCDKISDKHKLALSGECADEVFAGYPWYKKENNSNIFPWIRNIELKQDLLNDKYKKRLNLKKYVEDEYNKAINEAPVLEDDDSINKERQLSYINLRYFMLNLLDRKDRISSGCSLEVRVPFCDKDLVEVLYNVPLKYKNKEGIEKKLLRDAYKDDVINEVINRTKSPYPKSNSPIYDKLVKDLLIKALEDNNSVLYKIFNIDKIKELLDSENDIEPWYGQLMRKTALFAYLYQIDYWFKEYKMRLED